MFLTGPMSCFLPGWPLGGIVSDSGCGRGFFRWGSVLGSPTIATPLKTISITNPALKTDTGTDPAFKASPRHPSHWEAKVVLASTDKRLIILTFQVKHQKGAKYQPGRHINLVLKSRGRFLISPERIHRTPSQPFKMDLQIRADAWKTLRETQPEQATCLAFLMQPKSTL